MSKQREYFIFLDVLRDSGVTNMLGATPYLLEQFEELDKQAARKVLGEWMGSRAPKTIAVLGEWMDSKMV